jgi:glycosyltransferase involved in cell wall biosynthesis
VVDDGVQEALSPCDILVQVDNFEAGGLENVVIDLNETFGNAGYCVALLVLGNQGAAVKRARELGQTVICQAYSSETHSALLDQLQPKLLLAHYSMQGIALCHQKAIPFIQVIHNIYMWFNEQQRREFMEAAAMTTAFVAVSDYVKQYSVARLGVDPQKCFVIPNGIDFAPFKDVDSKFVRTDLRAKYGIAAEEFVFVDVGAINHQKNHLGVIRAFEIAAQICKNTRLIILGPCYEALLLQEMMSYVEERGLKNRVLYCGSAPSAHQHLAMADSFVSGAFFEGAQLILLEALAANLPIVTSGVGSANHFKGHKGLAVVEPAFDMIQFNGAIWELKSTQAFEKRLAAAMIETWKDPVRPNLSTRELAALEKGRAYESYVHLIVGIIQVGSVTGEGVASFGIV